MIVLVLAVLFLFILFIVGVVLISAVSNGITYSYVVAACKRRGVDGSYKYIIALPFIDRALLALVLYRVSHRINNPILGKVITNVAFLLTGVELYYNSKIGRSVQIWHGQGLVVGQNAKVGEGCVLLHQVTIGSGFVEIGTNVRIGCGAKILGNISIGKDCVVAANAVVTRDIPVGSLVKPDGEVRDIGGGEDLRFGTK